MPVSVCPVAIVEAPIETVWEVLTDPASYGEWWDAQTARIDPPGTAATGQAITASSRALGRAWPVVTRVLNVDADRHTLDLQTSLPFGISVRNHIVCAAVGATATRLAFG